MSTLPDRADRDRIEEDLNANLLVEAGAGAGKTRALADRAVALVAEGEADASEIAAITFTRRAAAELRERLQTRLEERLGRERERGGGPAVDRLDRGLRDLDRAFVGTIHSFCARLLRERPVDAGLAPDFQEVSGAREERMRDAFWQRHLERLARRDDPLLGRIRELGISPSQLRGGFARAVREPDVVLPRDRIEPPDPAPLRRDLESLLDRAYTLLPAEEPEDGWDRLQTRIRQLKFYRHVRGWEEDPAVFFEALAHLVERPLRRVLKRWGDRSLYGDVKELHAAFEKYAREGGPADRALRRWYAHRYPPAVEFVERAARAYAESRVEQGRLAFQDLLVGAAELLRESPGARRALARRFPRLLVDEFQDTDPVQAEIALLLSAREPTVEDWTRVVPRPGALFVVGDPKQSIYRFRRADIAVYKQVRDRFRELREQEGSGLADVLTLTANFRSHPPIEEFVNGFFRDRFPDQPTDRQAAFAPMRVQKGTEGAGTSGPAAGSGGDPPPRTGVFWYEARPDDGRSQEAVARSDAARVASWIRRRVTHGERAPGDFLILPYRKTCLHVYARALEARDVPVEVTGGELLVEEELEELLLLLRALEDPDDPTLTAAVLEGLFFGLDHEQLASHALEGDGRAERAPFRITRPRPDPDSEVEQALARLHRWWTLSRRQPADVLLETVVQELGLLPLAAAGELGSTRAGTLSFAMEAVRQAGVEEDASLGVAVEALESELASEEAEAPLEPGRSDAVRVMNLHKAKGTEAAVVILAHPTGAGDREPSFHSRRREDGVAEGWFVVDDPEDRTGASTVARPRSWPELAERERRFQEAEKVRLRYVAATRAEEELVVSRCPGTEAKSFWAPFYEQLEEEASKLDLEIRPPPEPRRLRATAEEMASRVERVEARRAAMDRPGWTREAVTERAKREGFRDSLREGDGRGAAWGTAFHRAVEAVGRGWSPAELEPLCRRLLREAGFTGAPEDGRERDAGPENGAGTRRAGPAAAARELAREVREAWDSPLLRRARNAGRVLFEVPFQAPGSGPGEGPRPILEGQIDLAFRESGGWVLADFKTDRGGPGALPEARLEGYRRQLAEYARAWEAVTGHRVQERVLYFSDSGRAVPAAGGDGS